MRKVKERGVKKEEEEEEVGEKRWMVESGS